MGTVTLNIDSGIATVRLENAKKLNVLTSGMIDELEQTFSRIDTDRAILGVVLTAEGDKAFCAGADIKAWSQLAPREFARGWIRNGHRVFDRIARLSKPTIAAINGLAFGGGLELACTCDMRIAVPNAEIALPEARVGVVPGWSGTQRLGRLLPEPVLKELAIFGCSLSTDRALQLGFVSYICEDPVKMAMEKLHKLRSRSSLSIELTKYMIHAAKGEDRSAMIDTIAGTATAASDDINEGIAAFLEKRQAQFND